MESTGKEEKDIDSEQGWNIGVFKPEDAVGVVDLFRSVYGAGYPIPKFIDPALLIESNRTQKTISIVIRTSDGRIVGHTALYQSAPWKRLYEMGATLVSSDFRGGKGLATEMIKSGIDVVAKLPEPGVVFGEVVCNHIYMQKIAHNVGFLPYALEVDLMPAEAYAAEKSAAGRVSTFLIYKTFQRQRNKVHIPRQYYQQMIQLYEPIDDDRDFRPSEANCPDEGESLIKVDYNDFAQTARLEVQRIAFNFGRAMTAIECDLLNKGAVVIQVWLNLSWPWVGKAVDELRRQGYFLGGVLPRWFDEDGFLMQKILGRPNWEGIQIASDRGKIVFDLVKKDWEQTKLI
ncbi:MAG: GNAT family N-acetyltransferase [Pseudomonadota bacterium]